MAIGGVVALVAGLSLGSYLSAGELLDYTPAPQMIVGASNAGGYEGVSFMTDASGRIPDYVLGTDSTRPPEPMPLVRTAWQEPAFAWDSPQADQPTPPVIQAPTAPPQAAQPPSIGGDILAVDAPSSAPPLG